MFATGWLAVTGDLLEVGIVSYLTCALLSEILVTCYFYDILVSSG